MPRSSWTVWPVSPNYFLNAVLLVSTFALMLFLAEGLLGILGLPAAYTYPPNFSQIRQNIEYQYEFKTNALGFRYRDIPIEKTAGTFRVHVAGDSFVEGVGVAQNETFCAILERRLNRPDRPVDFINGGLAGTGPKEYGDTFLGVGLKYRPDGLLLCVYANDLTETAKQIKNPLKRWFHRVFPNIAETVLRLKKRFRVYPEGIARSGVIENVSAIAVRRGTDPRRIQEWKLRLPVNLVAATDRGEFTTAILASGILNPRYWTDSLDIDTEIAESKWRRMTEILARIIGECRRRRIEPALVFIPSEFQYVSEYHRVDNPWIVSGTETRLKWLSGETKLQRRLKGWAGEKKIPFLDLTPLLRRSVSGGRLLTYSMDGHWNPEGHRIVAGLLENWINQDHVFTFFEPETTAHKSL